MNLNASFCESKTNNCVHMILLTQLFKLSLGRLNMSAADWYVNAIIAENLSRSKRGGIDFIFCWRLIELYSSGLSGVLCGV